MNTDKKYEKIASELTKQHENDQIKIDFKNEKFEITNPRGEKTTVLASEFLNLEPIIQQILDPQVHNKAVEQLINAIEKQNPKAKIQTDRYNNKIINLTLELGAKEIKLPVREPQEIQNLQTKIDNRTLFPDPKTILDKPNHILAKLQTIAKGALKTMKDQKTKPRQKI